MIDIKAVEQYLNVVKSLKPKTVYAVKNRLEYLDHALLDVTQASVIGFIGEYKSKMSSSATNSIIIAWGHYIDFLNYNEIPHPYKKVGTIKTASPPAREFLDPEVMRDIAEVELDYGRRTYNKYLNPLYRLVFMFYALTGARVSELLGLKIKDISIETKSCWFMETKNGQPRRVLLPDEIITLMKPFINKDPERYLIESSKGGSLAPKYINNELKKRAIAIGYTKNIHVHLFRHSFVSLLLQSGVDITVLARYIGHRSINTTFSTYGHLVDQMYKDALNKHPLVQDKLDPSEILKQDLETMKRLRIFKDKRFIVKINEGTQTVEILVAVK